VKKIKGIVYEDRGLSKIPIICLHGIGGDTTSFQPQLEYLSSDCRIIAWNMPGYGGSAPLREVSFETLTRKLRDFIIDLNISAVHLCGQSIGGMLALEMAFVYPKLITSLVLIGTTPAFGGKDETFKEEFTNARLKPLDEGKTIKELSESFIREVVGPEVSDIILENAKKSMAAVPEKTYRDIINCLVKFNRREDITNLKIPCCIISGEFDRNAPAKTMARMAEKIPNSEYHEIKGAGHLINLEAGDITNKILSEFYRRIE